jgi:Pyruvate/2-oxoacid:ferredoxin oxidoreductase delta subunit
MHFCTQFCPEANTIQYDKERNTAFVSVDRCKGVCSAFGSVIAWPSIMIKMVMIDQLQSMSLHLLTCSTKRLTY